MGLGISYLRYARTISVALGAMFDLVYSLFSREVSSLLSAFISSGKPPVNEFP